MASLQQYKGKYYCLVSYKKENGKYSNKLIPTGLKQEKRARVKLLEVERQEKLFKEGRIKLDDISVEKPPQDKNIKPKDHNYKRSWNRVINQFLRYKEKKVKSKTIKLYEIALKHLKNIFSNKRYMDINKADQEYFEKELSKIYDCNTTYNIRIRSIRSFFRWLKDEGKIKELPYKFEKKKTKSKRPRYFTDQEITQILETAEDNKELYARIYVHWKTGMRLRELGHSYAGDGYITVYDPDKQGKERDIPADPKTLKQYKIAKEGDYLPGTISKKFLQIVRDLGIYRTREGDKRSFHSLRHTYAVRTYYKLRTDNQQDRLYKLMLRLGHSNISTTQIYNNFSESRLKQDFYLIQDKEGKKHKGRTHLNQRNGRTDQIRTGNSEYYSLNQDIFYNAE